MCVLISLAKDAVEKYGEKVQVVTCSNVLDDEMEEPLREQADEGCDIIFFNGYSELVMKLAPEYPNTQFCQTSYMDMSGKTVPANYHTFKGEAYQGRYVSGIAAGMKIKQMIDEGVISDDEAIVGFRQRQVFQIPRAVQALRSSSPVPFHSREL